MKEMNRREFLTLTGAAVVALSLDSGLDPAMELVVKIAKGDMKFGDAMGDLSEVMKRYNDLSAPIGIAADKDTGNMMPVCIYLDDVEKMAQNLPLQVDDGAKEALKSASLIAIQVFEYGGGKYWVALVAKGKVTP